MVARALLLLGAAPALAARSAEALDATLDSAAPRELWARARLTSADADCTAIRQCYCIKRTACGWCDSAGRGMLGNEDGPFDSAEPCFGWVDSAEDCPQLLCQDDERPWRLQCAWLPCLCLSLWLSVLVWREVLREKHLSPPQLEALAMEVVQPLVSQNTTATDGGPSQAALAYLRRQIYDTFGAKRTFLAFRRGLRCPTEERLPDFTGRPYELNLSVLSAGSTENIDTSRVGPHSFRATLCVALQWRTALGASLVTATGIMFLSSLYLSLMRSAARMLPKSDYMWLAGFSTDAVAIASPLRKAVGIVLSFYALDRVAWYWRILMLGYMIHGRTCDLGMIGGGIKKASETEWRKAYRLYRYLALNVFFAYQFHTPVWKFVGMRPLTKCGLLEPEEAKILRASHRGASSVMEAWLANWIAENMQGESRQQALQALRELRAGSAVLQATVEQRAPISFESMLYFVSYFLIAITPFAPSGIDYANRRMIMEGLQLATVLGDGIITVFYVALLHMLRHLQSPFDDFASPNDALSPVALLNHTERKLRDYLSAPDPDDILEGFDGQAPAISFRGAPAAPPAFRPGRRPSL